jgi:RimJ/RimL family protein N-acetyltransferase
MDNPDLLKGKLVRLTAEDPKVIAEANVRWAYDSEYVRLLDSNVGAPVSVKKITEWIEKDLEKDPPSEYSFMIRRLEDERLVGMIGLGGSIIPHGEAFVGIGIGERALWGKGYGTDAMRVILRYGFTELNLRRVSLDVFEYNPRAIRSYEKAGFVHEGRVRQYLHRSGRRWDLVFMGILREEWMNLQETSLRGGPL